jgi:hypothetical protein
MGGLILAIAVFLIDRYRRRMLGVVELFWLIGVAMNIYIGWKCFRFLEISWHLMPWLSIPIAAALGLLPYLLLIFAVALVLKATFGGSLFGPRRPS